MTEPSTGTSEGSHQQRYYGQQRPTDPNHRTPPSYGPHPYYEGTHHHPPPGSSPYDPHQHHHHPAVPGSKAPTTEPMYGQHDPASYYPGGPPPPMRSYSYDSKGSPGPHPYIAQSHSGGNGSFDHQNGVPRASPLPPAPRAYPQGPPTHPGPPSSGYDFGPTNQFSRPPHMPHSGAPHQPYVQGSYGVAPPPGPRAYAPPPGYRPPPTGQRPMYAPMTTAANNKIVGPPTSKAKPPARKATTPQQIEAFRRQDALTVGCTCRKSKCLKLYCMCFSSNVLCTTNCRCYECSNTVAEDRARKEARRLIISRNPTAFSSKFASKKPSTGAAKTPFPNSSSNNSAAKPDSSKLVHKLGCKCRRSACLKKYCECFHANVKCSKQCRCVGCQNFPENGNSNGRSGTAANTVPIRPTATTSEPWMMNAAQNLAVMKSSPSPQKAMSRTPYAPPPPRMMHAPQPPGYHPPHTRPPPYMAGIPPGQHMMGPPPAIRSGSFEQSTTPTSVTKPPMPDMGLKHSLSADEDDSTSASVLLEAAMAMTQLHKDSPAKSSPPRLAASDPIGVSAGGSELPPMKRRRVEDGDAPPPPPPPHDFARRSLPMTSGLTPHDASPVSRVSAEDGEHGNAGVVYMNGEEKQTDDGTAETAASSEAAAADDLPQGNKEVLAS